ncbi:CLUMA_CG013373, isoform A [Clunio marinus]|uniref:CLUMA_CG013373, isoform A n=1 Tax=Clunio marinus TaxID=568069 RepID=A0A1J1IIP7_9DIPT|nr:CLUMA_CG013373, isoform A [Clunio marinus]
MTAISEYESSRLMEFFRHHTDNEKKLISIAKTITKNTLTHLTLNDAYKIVLLHSESVSSILNRKPISKEILLKYLTDNNIAVTNNFTKTSLVEQVIDFWRSTEHGNRQPIASQQHIFQQQHQHSIERLSKKSEDFPVNVMSRNFSSWFYKNLNDNTIQINDFWSDSTCVIKIIDSSGDVKEDSTITSALVLNLLFSTKTQFNFYFNPNLSYEGTRGKMEHHGIVLVLCCGTLHTQASVAVGFFESVFGLMRDPFSDNNWKIKSVKLQLQSTPSIGMQKLPALENCNSLQQFMTLPEHEDNL